MNFQPAQMIFLLRISKINRKIQQIDEFLDLTDIYQGIFDLTKLLTFIIYIAHISCCIWHALAQIEVNNGKQSWLHEYKLIDESWYYR